MTEEASSNDVVAGVDVGTGSARAGLFALDGTLLAHAAHPIAIQRPDADFVEQDSEDIWRAVGLALRAALAQGGIDPARVKGLAFDATCSLVVRDRVGRPLSVSPSGEDRWDTIVWADHRARPEAEECSATGSPVLDYVGGAISPEMEVPKLLWLKRHKPATWLAMGAAYDLADFLSWRATGSNARSACTLTCKWTYLGHRDQPWDEAFFAKLGLDDIRARTQLPDRAVPIGAAVGRLTEEAARDLGLTTATMVAAGLIDAHAGALGTLGPRLGGPHLSGTGGAAAADRAIALIAGTSNCHMAVSPEPRPIKGVWGPYLGAVMDGLWLNEGGQSATGALLDHVVASHAGRTHFSNRFHDELAQILLQRIAGEPDLAPRLHMLPDYHGNRSPLADPDAVGVISGLTMIADTKEQLVRLYWATAAAIGYGTRHIIDAMNRAGYAIDSIALSGGHAASPFLVRMYADTTGATIGISACPEPVLLGTAMAAAVGSGAFPTLAASAQAMGAAETMVAPDPQARAAHDRRYRVFLEMHAQRRTLDHLIHGDRT